MTVYGSVTDVGTEDMQQALAQGHVNLLSLQASHDASQKLLVSEQHLLEHWHCESPSTDVVYNYIAQLADSWLHALVLPVSTTVHNAAQLQEKWQAHAKTACLGRACCMLPNEAK